MTRIISIDPTQATGRTQELFTQVQQAFGKVPNVIKAMATAPAVLQSYLDFNTRLSQGVLDRQLCECIAMAVAEFDGCEYCLSVHVMLGKRAGLSTIDIAKARQFQSSDSKTEIALKFVNKILMTRGHVTEADVVTMQQAGYTDEEIVEVIGHVAINVFTNYFNIVVQTEIDFPRVRLNAEVAV